MTDEEFRAVYDGNNNMIYKGFARPGTTTTETGWQIAYLTYDGNDNVLSIQWPLQVLSSSAISSQTIGTVTTPWTSFSGNLTHYPAAPGSVSLVVGALTYTDNGAGVLSGGGSNTGTVNYATGAITLVINPALITNTSVVASYNWLAVGSASNDYLFQWSIYNSYIYV